MLYILHILYTRVLRLYTFLWILSVHTLYSRRHCWLSYVCFVLTTEGSSQDRLYFRSQTTKRRRATFSSGDSHVTAIYTARLHFFFLSRTTRTLFRLLNRSGGALDVSKALVSGYLSRTTCTFIRVSIKRTYFCNYPTIGGSLYCRIIAGMIYIHI